MLTQVEQQRLRPIRGLGDSGAIGSKTGRSCARDKTRDESSREATTVEESSINSR